MSDPPLYDLRLGNALSVLKTLPDESVHCCCTSPPYLGLRSYNLPPTVWGGREDCDHDWGEELRARQSGGDIAKHWETVGIKAWDLGERSQGAFCSKCTAWLGCLGLEPDPETYVRNLVLVFEEVRRVLSKRGTLWLNIGDSYAGGQCGRKDDAPAYLERRAATYGTGRAKAGRKGADATANKVPRGLKPKDLMMMPARVALALQAAGWWLRADIIWAKENPLPESVRDRPTRSHEYLFLLTRSAKYWYDGDAVMEPVSTFCRFRGNLGQKTGANGDRKDGGRFDVYNDHEGRNLRSVWSIPVQPFPGAHFATMPERLVEPCVKAGCPPGGVVLDPFTGSGTVGVVALQHGRRFLGIDMQPDYFPLIAERLARYEGLGLAPEEATIQGPRTLSLGI